MLLYCCYGNVILSIL